MKCKTKNVGFLMSGPPLRQTAALPFDELMMNAFDDHFVIWEPRDVVGGDMYWLIPVPDGFILGVADCTGHGVPGAFVTLLASGARPDRYLQSYHDICRRPVFTMGVPGW